MSELESVLADAARHFPSLPIEPTRRFLQEILRWNDEVALVSKKDPVAACGRLVLESAEFGDVVARALLRDAVRVADVGSGAGFPGVVWRLLHPSWDLTLIERREKKALFVERTARLLSLPNLDVVAADARDASRDARYRGRFDVVATMAVGEPARTAPQIEELLAPNGLFATTLPDDVAAADRCGARLVLEDDVRAQFGRYALYRNRV